MAVKPYIPSKNNIQHAACRVLSEALKQSSVGPRHQRLAGMWFRANCLNDSFYKDGPLDGLRRKRRKSRRSRRARRS